MPRQQPPPFDPSQATPAICLDCNGEFFDKAYRVAIVSVLAPGNATGKNIVLEYPVYLCHKCGKELQKP